MPATKDTRHAASRSTGATTWTRKEGDQWTTTCLNHKAEATAPNRAAAWKNGSTPAQFCPKCKAIAAGKVEKIAVGRFDLPTPKATKSASGKKPLAQAAAKPAAKEAT